MGARHRDTHPNPMQGSVFQLVGPERNVQLFGIRLLGLNAHNLHKLIFSLIFLAIVWLLRALLLAVGKALRTRESKAAVFWTGQGISLVTFTLGLLGLLSIWFDNPERLATGVGLVGAGLAFALQKVITSFAGYFIILRGKTFSVGDRIAMGGVRGDVVNLSFFQTTIMEMGTPPRADTDGKASWVQSRQFSGRIVTVANSKIFDDPVFNYTHEFPFIWEEMHVPITYKDDRHRVEQILLEAAQRETARIEDIAAPALKQLEERFLIHLGDLDPHVYWRITDNWVELTVRFLTKSHDVRALKDRMSRFILTELDKAGIGIASSTFDIVGLPPLKLETTKPA